MEYYYSYNNEKTGPISLEELKKIDLKKDTLIWHDGLDKWVKAEELDDFKDLFIDRKIEMHNKSVSDKNDDTELKKPEILKENNSDLWAEEKAFMKKIIAISLIICISFIGMTSSFYIAINFFNNGYLYGYEWYDLFVPIEIDNSVSIAINADKWLDESVKSQEKLAMNDLRIYILISTFFFFLIGLFSSYKYYYKNMNTRFTWGIILIILYLTFFG